MSVLDIVFVALLSSAILFLLFSFLMIILRISTGKRLKALPQKKIKNKRKRKKVLKVKRQLEKKRKKQLTWFFLFLLLGLTTGGSAAYSRYYQLMNLTADDSAAIAKSYYLVDEIDKQLKSVGNGASPEKVKNSLRDLTAQLASTTVRKASGTLATDKQKLLSRYYSSAEKLSINISNLSVEDLKKQEKRDEYLGDIEKVVEAQQKVFKEFKVNESALKQEK